MYLFFPFVKGKGNFVRLPKTSAWLGGVDRSQGIVWRCLARHLISATEVLWGSVCQNIILPKKKN